MNPSNQYFASMEPEKTAQILLDKANSWFNQLEANGYLEKLRIMWASYHGVYFDSWSDSHSITFSGEQGELTNIAVNHLRNLAQHMLVMVTATRPSLQARAVNTDHKSMVQARLANGLLDYYMREKRLEDYIKDAVESAIVYGSGYIKMEWNATVGEVYDYIQSEDGMDEEIREGEVQFSNLSPFDVVFDPNREDDKHNWVLVRSFKNRHDIIAKYPEYEDKILMLQTKADIDSYGMGVNMFSDTDEIPIYELYHKKTESLPEGRYLLFLSGDIALLDSPLPYRDIPVYKISPSRILGTPFGYTPLFDILPIQDAINSLYSTILTNQSTFGVQNILSHRGSDISMSSISGGLNIIEGNFSNGKPEALNLTNTPREIFDFLQMLESVAETISGVNSVARGNPESNLKSGNAMALVQSMSLQFMSGLQQSYVKMIEDVGTGLINMLKDFANTPRIAAIAGIRNRTSMKEFTGEDLSNVNRVIVDIGNPLSKSTAGRVEMAEQLLQMGVIKTAEHYFSVLNTGNLEAMTEDTQSELDLIRAENEALLSNTEVIAVATDQHTIHIKEHKAVLADPDLRKDPELLRRTLAHIQEHITLLRETDPDLLNIIQEQPLGPAGGSPANQNPNMPPDASMQGQAPQMMEAPSAEAPAGPLPSPARPPGEFSGLPVLAEEVAPQG